MKIQLNPDWISESKIQKKIKIKWHYLIEENLEKSLDTKWNEPKKITLEHVGILLQKYCSFMLLIVFYNKDTKHKIFWKCNITVSCRNFSHGTQEKKKIAEKVQ